MQPNALYYGDCLDWMERWDDQSVDLIYLDPPFGTGKHWGVFDDTWHWDTAAAARYAMYERAAARPAHRVIVGLHHVLGESGMLAYLTYMAERLEQMHRLLKLSGSLYFHCDPTVSHYVKLVLDAIFGAGNFRNEIVWCYKSRPQSKRYFGRKHDCILFYAKSSSQVFAWGRVTRPLTEATRRKYRLKDQAGRLYRLQGRGITGSPLRSAKDVAPQWEIDRPDLVVRDYLDQKIGVAREDWWIDINILNQTARERLGYPTQKPLALLERIIKASSNPGDVIMDPFCGSGTTIHAAQSLARRWIGIDISEDACALARECLSCAVQLRL